MEDFPAIAMLVFGGVCLVSHIKTVSALQRIEDPCKVPEDTSLKANNLTLKIDGWKRKWSPFR